LQRLYVLGDSISLHYGPYLEKMIAHRYYYDRKGGIAEANKNLDRAVGANGGDSRMVLDFLPELLGNGPVFDYLLLNSGLHDIKTNQLTGTRQIPEKEYEENLKTVLKLLSEASKKIIWVTTTPVDDERHGKLQKEFLRYDTDVLRYNHIAAGIMRVAQAPIIDLGAFTRLFDGEIYSDHVHFTPEVQRLQAAFIAGALYSILSI
jgi:hypothetical protein